MAMVTMLGGAFFLVKVMHSPIEFTFHDEFGFWRMADNIRRSGHLFGPSPLVDDLRLLSRPFGRH